MSINFAYRVFSNSNLYWAKCRGKHGRLLLITENMCPDTKGKVGVISQLRGAELRFELGLRLPPASSTCDSTEVSQVAKGWVAKPPLFLSPPSLLSPPFWGACLTGLMAQSDAIGGREALTTVLHFPQKTSLPPPLMATTES